MANWNLIENQSLLKTIFKRPPIISYKRGKSLKDIACKSKNVTPGHLPECDATKKPHWESVQVCL